MPFNKDDVAAVRYVNGAEVALTDGERQAIAEEWGERAAAVAADLKAIEIERKRATALGALEQLRLAEASADPNAPQAVKDYVEALQIKP